MPTTVELPDGVSLEFPDGMDELSMHQEISKAFPQFSQQTPTERTAIPAPGEGMPTVQAQTLVAPGQAFPAQQQAMSDEMTLPHRTGSAGLQTLDEALSAAVRQEPPTPESEIQPIGKEGTFLRGASSGVAGVLNRPEYLAAMMNPATAAAVGIYFLPQVSKQFLEDLGKASKGDNEALGRAAVIGIPALIGGVEVGRTVAERAASKTALETAQKASSLSHIDALARMESQPGRPSDFAPMPGLPIRTQPMDGRPNVLTPEARPLTSTEAEDVFQLGKATEQSNAELQQERTPDATIPERSAAEIPVEEPPSDSGEVGARAPVQEEAALPQKEEETKAAVAPVEESGGAIRDVARTTPTLDVERAENLIAEKLRDTGEVASGEFTLEGVMRVLGLNDSRQIQPLVDIGILQKSEHGFEFSDSIQQKATPKTLPPEPAAEGVETTAAPTSEPTPAGEVEPAGVSSSEDQIPERPPTSEAATEHTGMGADVYNTSGESVNVVSNMKAIINQERVARGEEPMPETTPRTWDDDRSIAEGRMQANPDYVPGLIQELLQNPRPLTSTEISAANLQRSYWSAELKNAWRRRDEAARDGREADRIEAQLDADKFSGHLNDMDKAFGIGGGAATEAGRSLGAQQAGVTDDLDIVRIRMEKEEALGRPLEKDEIAELEKKVEEFKAAKETLARDLEQRTKEAAEETAKRLVAETRAQLAEKALPPPQVMRFIGEVRASVKKAADESRDYFKGKVLSFTPQDMYHLARISLDNLFDIGDDFAKWSVKMTMELGAFAEKTKPLFQALFDDAKNTRYAELAKKNIKRTPAVDKALKDENPAIRQGKMVDALKEAKTEGIDPKELSKYVRSIVETVIEEGEMEHHAIFQKTGDILRKAGIDLTEDDLQGIYGGYGDYGKSTPAPTERVPVRMAQLRGESQKFQGLKTVLDKNTPPLAIGKRRVKQSDLARRIAQQIHEAMKERGVATQTTESHLAGALDARKNYRRNRMKDLRHEMATGRRIIAKKSVPITDAELEAMDAEYQQLKREHAEAFPKQPLTDEQRVAIELRTLDREISAQEAANKAGDVLPKAKAKRLSTPELEAKRARLDALRSQRDELRSLNQEWNEKKQAEALERQKISVFRQIDEKEKALSTGKTEPAGQEIKRPAHPSIEPLLQQRDELNRKIAEARKKPADVKAAEAMERKAVAITNRILALQKKIASGDLATKSAAVNRPLPGDLEPLQQLVDALNKQIEKLRNPPKTRDQIASQAAIRYANNRISEMQDKMARGDFEPKPVPTKPNLSSDAQKARADMARIKIEFDRAKAKDAQSKRGPFEKLMDGIARWKRINVLTYPSILWKLTAAAAEGIGLAGAEGAVARGMSPFLPKSIREGAIRYGRGTTIEIETNALSDTVINFVKNFKDAAKTGNLELDLAYGKPQVMPEHFMDWVGNLHYALKTPLMQNEWSRSFKTIMRNEALNGVDVSNPVVMERIKNQAYRYATERLFLEDNRFVSAYNSFMRTIVQKDKLTGKPSAIGKAAETAIRYQLPIVRIPTNLIKRTFEYQFGLAKGGFNLINAIRKGVDTLSAEEKDVIVRNLSRGTVGAALMFYGWANSDNIGGYYQPGEKKPKVPHGGMTLFGHQIPRVLLHNPALESIQFGATAHHVFKKMLGKRLSPASALGEGAWASLMGLIEETPFVGEIKREIRNSTSGGKFAGEQIRGAIPGIAQWSAGRLDLQPGTGGFLFGTPRQRTPKGFIQTVEMGIPGLRQKVPLKQAR